MKKFVQKFFMILCVLIFSTSICSCNTEKEINYSYTLVNNRARDFLAYSKIITNKDELDDFFINVFEIIASDYEQSDYEKYDEKFFKKNNLITFIIETSSMADEYIIESYQIENGTLLLNLYRVKSGHVYTIGYFCYFLELSKKETANINNIEVKQYK